MGKFRLFSPSPPPLSTMQWVVWSNRKVNSGIELRNLHYGGFNTNRGRLVLFFLSPTSITVPRGAPLPCRYGLKIDINYIERNTIDQCDSENNLFNSYIRRIIFNTITLQHQPLK